MSAETETKKIEEVEDDDMPELEEVENAQPEQPAEAPAPAPMNRNEKKVRKAFEKLKLEPVEGYYRITMVKQRNCMVVKNPDVYKGKGNSYIVFGELKNEDTSKLRAAQQMAEANRMEQEIIDAEKAENAAAGGADDDDVEEVETGDVDEDGLEAKDIELVMAQAGASRGKAVAALKAADGDVVNAIMELGSN